MSIRRVCCGEIVDEVRRKIEGCIDGADGQCISIVYVCMMLKGLSRVTV